MEAKDNHQAFSELVKKAYEKGVKEDEITVAKLLEQLKIDLKNIVVN
ncbi:MAG: hypothetical protein AB2392_22990 [Neobacillus sp.]